MKLLPAFSALLLALEISAAVQSDQLGYARLVKVKRAISQGPDRIETERPQPNLQKRVEPFGTQLETLVREYHSASPDAASSVLAKLRDLLDRTAQGGPKVVPYAPKPHTPASWENHGSGALSGLAPQLSEHARILDRHEGLLREQDKQLNELPQHAGVLHQHAVRLADHDESLEAMKDLPGIVNNHEKYNRKAHKNMMFAIAGAAMVGTTGAVTSAMYSGMANNRFSRQSDDIDALKAEVERLKAANGQQVPGYSNGWRNPGPDYNLAPLVPGSGVPATHPVV